MSYLMFFMVWVGISYLIITAAFEYPTFGIFLLLLIMIFASSTLREWNRDKELEGEKKKQSDIKHRRKEKLKDQAIKEMASIVEKDFQKIAKAYRNTVTENAFGKKNYDKFTPQLSEYLFEQSEKAQDWVDENDWSHEDFINTYIKHAAPGLIKVIESMLKEQDEDMEFSKSMDPYEYEQFCANEFKKTGWNAKTTKASSDQGVDVVAQRDDQIIVAQCKRFSKPVGNKAVQEVVAGMKFYDANAGIVIAPNGFTNSAEKLAAANKIKLIHHSQIKDL